MPKNRLNLLGRGINQADKLHDEIRLKWVLLEELTVAEQPCQSGLLGEQGQVIPQSEG